MRKETLESIIIAGLVTALGFISIRKSPFETEGFYRGYHDENNGTRTIYLKWGNSTNYNDSELEPAILDCEFDVNKVDSKSNDYLKIQGYQDFWGAYATNIVKERR